MDKKAEISPIQVILGIVALIALVLLGISIMRMFRKNPYGEQILISNFSQYFSNTPEDTRDSVFASLYKIVNDNGVGVIPKSGATIRAGSAENSYDDATDVHSARFVVDIEEIGQSYEGFFEWSSKKDNPALSGYAVLFSCLDEEQLRYGDFGCKDMFSDLSTTKYPIITKLPLKVEFYANNYSSYTHYYIGYEEKEDGLVLNIIDYSGGNRENAINKIKELGFNPADYEITYQYVGNR